MGHERIGFLPRTQHWNDIIEQLSNYDDSSVSVANISHSTLNNIKSTYEAMPYDESVIMSIKYLATLSVSANKDDQVSFLCNIGFAVDDNTLSLLSLIRSAKAFITTETDSLETNKIAQDSVLQALSSYERANNNNQLSLFGDTRNVWNEIGSGAAFCDLARRFFASFTDRYLRYYLEREAAHSINNFKSIEKFSEQISKHAYETSKIMQSFAAGWFNKFAANDVPSNGEITRFLNIAFGKMREEFRREAEHK